MASQKKKDDPYKNLKEHKAIMQILNGLYGNCLDVNIIESVVSSQQWNRKYIKIHTLIVNQMNFKRISYFSKIISSGEYPT